MPSRLGVQEKRIKTFMQAAGIKRPDGRTCRSHLKYLEKGCIVMAYKDGAVFFWPDGNEHYEEYVEKNKNEGRPVAFLYIVNNVVVKIGDLVLRDTILRWRDACKS